jgi:tetratricopeptide (TPR) repeat protein
LSAITTIVAFMALFTLQNTRTLEHMSVLHRIVLSVYGLTFYLVKTAVPLELAPLYELAVVFVPWRYFAFVLAALVVCVVFRRRWPALAAAGAMYLVTLAPVLGTFQNGPQAVADRYTYLACLGWALLLGAAGAGGWAGSNVARGVLAVWILALLPLTWQQVHIWHDPVTMWQYDVTVYPNARAGNYNLAAAYENAGRYPEAIVHYQEIQRLSVRKAQWYVPMGEVYEKAKVYRLAIESFREALRLDPDLSKPACAGLMRIRERDSLEFTLPPACL